MKYRLTINSLIGPLTIESTDSKISALYFKKIKNTKEIPNILKTAQKQLEEYFSGKRTEFNLSFEFSGSPFQKKVWTNMCKIPFGKTLSYKELSEKAGSPKGARACGNACNKNPLPIFIPCHRVLSSKGNLTGYAGGLKIKKTLLSLETL